MNLPDIIKKKYGSRFEIYTQKNGLIIGLAAPKNNLDTEIEALNKLFAKHGYKRSSDIYCSSGMRIFDCNYVTYTFIKQ